MNICFKFIDFLLCFEISGDFYLEVSQLCLDKTHATFVFLQEFHVMRDHPRHMKPIMGGMFDVKVSKDRSKFQNLLNGMLNNTKHSLAPRTERNHDQLLLKKFFWPIVGIQEITMSHDSYNCEIFNFSIGFPTRRKTSIANNYVGAIMKSNSKLQKPCPKLCRPKEHPEWTYC